MDLYIACAYVDSIDTEHLPLKTHGSEITSEQLGELYNVDPTRIVLRQGRVVETLQEICNEVDPSIVVMGTLARTGFSGKLIGNTAEKCSILLTPMCLPLTSQQSPDLLDLLRVDAVTADIDNPGQSFVLRVDRLPG